MPVYKTTLIIERDGVVVQSYPKVRTVSVNEAQSFDYEKADDGDSTTFSSIPISALDAIQFLTLEADQELTFRFNGQTDAGVLVKAGGNLVMVNCNIDPASVTVNNNSGEVAQIKGIAAGTPPLVA